MNQASLLERVRLGAECRKVLMLVVCFVLNETKLTSNGETKKHNTVEGETGTLFVSQL